MCLISQSISGQTIELTQANIEDGFTGKATFQYKNGDTYSGDWLKGKKHGKGIYTFGNDIPNKDHEVFSGFSGYLAKTAVVYEGNWANDKANGVGSMRYNNSVHNISSEYVGEWQDGHFHGQGKLSFSTGDYYDGAWEKGSKIGTAIVRYKYRDDAIYEGSTLNNSAYGLGKFTYPNGDVYIGEMDVKPNGQGTMYYADGHSITGSFKNGKYVTPE